MRLILMGTGPFALPAFSAIADRPDLEIAAVVTKPTAEAKNAAESPVASWAQRSNLVLLQPKRIRDAAAVAALKSLRADLAVVCDYGQILSRDALDAARLGSINLHGSLLPRHRGAAPVQWAILSGDKTSGISVIRMTEGLDAGAIITAAETEILPDENAEELERRLSVFGVDPTLKAIERLRACDDLDAASAVGIPQNDLLATKAPRLRKTDGQLDFRMDAAILDRIIRGLQPWPGAYADLETADGKLTRCSIHRAVPTAEPDHLLAADEQYAVGVAVPWDLLDPVRKQQICAVTSGPPAEMYVRCGRGWLGIREIQAAGKRRMSSGQFAAGSCRGRTARFQIPDATTLIV